MRGSIVKRQGKGRRRGKPVDLYYIVYQVGQRQKWEAVDEPRTRKHAEEVLAKRLQELHSGTYVEPKESTFSDFKTVWMRDYAEGEGEIRQSTLENYRGYFKNHLIPAFGDRLLDSLTTKDIQGFKARLLASGKKVIVEGEIITEGLSPQTAKHVIRLLRQMLDHACDWGYLRSNPAAKVKNPKIPRREQDAYSPEEVRRFLEKLPENWYAFFICSVVGGLRVGEVIAMKWQNVDWERGQYFVKESWSRPQGGRPGHFSTPKTEASIAPVDLTPSCLEALRAHRKLQSEEKLKTGGQYPDHDLVFATAKGMPLSDGNLTRRIFSPTLTEANLRRIRLHDLRHTCASLLIAQNESPKYIQKQMRHSSIQVTFDTYGHLFPDTNREASKRLDSTIFGKQQNAETA
jgi:integrase